MHGHEITHKEIYERLIAVEQTFDKRMSDVELKVDTLNTNTAGVVDAFNAAQGAFKTLEFLGKLAKPLLWIGGLMTAAGVLWQSMKS